MQAKRAEEIINSPQITNVVYYADDPVWLNHLNSNDTVNVRFLAYNERETVDVPVGELKETGDVK